MLIPIRGGRHFLSSNNEKSRLGSKIPLTYAQQTLAKQAIEMARINISQPRPPAAGDRRFLVEAFFYP